MLFGPPGFNWCCSFALELVQLTQSVSPHFLFILEFIMIYLFVHDDSLTS